MLSPRTTTPAQPRTTAAESGAPTPKKKKTKKIKPTLQASPQKVKKSGQTPPEENAPGLSLTFKPPARSPPCANTLGPVFMLQPSDTPYRYNGYV